MSKSWIKNSPGIRLVIIGALALVLLIGALMIQSLISEREGRRQEAVFEVSEKWGQSQIISGPVLTIPYLVYFKNDKDQVISSTRYAHYLPDKLEINGQVDPQVRKRGIYEVVLYESRIKIAGQFIFPDLAELGINNQDVLWTEAFISLGISDMKGIQEIINLKWNDEVLEVQPGIETNEVIGTGVSVPVEISNEKAEYRYELSLNLNGSESVMFTPVGQMTEAALSSSWNNPGFDGRFIPDSHDLDQNGFTANWKILHLNRSFPQQWLGKKYKIDEAHFGFRLLLPVDQYQKTMRTAKYALLFIMLTFLSFFMVELMNKKTLHPIQYLLIGLALLIFYTLLLSFSEHMSFGSAYLIASVAIVGLISLYAQGMLKSSRLSVIIAGILSVLYGYLYVILQLQDYALLMGSLGLFAALALTMYLTRKIDWYTILNRSNDKSEPDSV